MMPYELIFSMGAGLIALGIGIVLVSFFIKRLLRRVYPDGDQAWRGFKTGNGSINEKKKLALMEKRYRSFMSHSMVRLGCGVVFSGFLLISFSLFYLK